MDPEPLRHVTAPLLTAGRKQEEYIERSSCAIWETRRREAAVITNMTHNFYDAQEKEKEAGKE